MPFIRRLKSTSLFSVLDSARLKHAFCLVATILAVIFKFWLIAQMEITDALDDPHEYVLQILYPVNGGLAYPPGTGLVGRFFYEFGIPFRLGIEIAYIFSAALVLRALFTWPTRSYLSLGLFLLMIFNPAAPELFSHLMSDQVWLVESMLGLSCLVLAMEGGPRPKWGYISLAIFFFGLTAVTRSTFLPLMASVLAFAIVSFVLLASKFTHAPNKNHAAILGLSTSSLLFGVVLIYYGTCFYDSTHHGYFGVSAIDCSEYKKFYTCLQSVGDDDDDTHFPIDEARRKLIRQAGPTSQWFVEQVEKNTLYKQVGIDRYGKSDIPGGWFHFATFNAVLPAANGDLRKSFEMLETIEHEIAQAHQQGSLKVRPVLPLPDSRLHLVLAAFPEGLKNTVGMIVHQPPPDAFSPGNFIYKSSEFSEALSRRTVMEGPAQEKIWGLLCLIYAGVYLPALFYFFLLVLMFFVIVLAFRWNRFEEAPLSFIAQQAFVLFFLVHIFWYALFDASGLSIYARYVIFQNIMLPVLIIYYLRMIPRLLKSEL